jgi:hypothetical protein
MKRLSTPPDEPRFVAVTAYGPASADPAPAESRPNASRLAAAPERIPDTPRHRAGLASIAISAIGAAASAKRALADTRIQITNLQAALGTRAVIGQATGMLMVSRRLSADQAFALLIRTSQHDNIKVSRLAALIVAEPSIIDRLEPAAPSLEEAGGCAGIS